VGPEFLNLQWSPAGFGHTREEAVRALRASSARLATPTTLCRSSATSRCTANDHGFLPAARRDPAGLEGCGPGLPGHMRVTRHDDPAWHAAYCAFREVLPEMPEEQAKQETTHAIAYAAPNHTGGSGAACTGRKISRLRACSSGFSAGRT
jgi:hypothetical protein